MKINTKHTLLWAFLFAAAMGFLEAAVVVYLRELYYPTGFSFPLVPLAGDIALVEFLREAATMVMLLGLGILAGRTATEKFAYFMFGFGVWDIFYYVFLKLLIHWPESLLTWDILFLIPVIWTGPVLSPVIVASTMILLALLVTRFTGKRRSTRIGRREWALLAAGAGGVFLAFIWDYSAYILKYYSAAKLWTVPSRDLFDLSIRYIPVSFNWILFGLGELVILAGIGLFYLRNKRARTIEEDQDKI